MTRTSALYLGTVMHARTDELIHRAFRYPLPGLNVLIFNNWWPV